MNKKGALGLVAGLVVLLAAGGYFYFQADYSQAPESEEKQADRAHRLPLDAHMSESYTDDLPDLLQKRYIRVLTTLNQTNFFISDGHLVGYEYSLLKGYEKFLNSDIHMKDLQVVLEFIPVARDELIPRLKKGYGDIAAAGLTITPRRQKLVDFTDPYLSGVSEVVVTHKDNSSIQDIYDLSGRQVAVRESSSYYESLKRLNAELRKQDRKAVDIVSLSEELETEDILEMVNSGALDITVADSHIAGAWKEVLKNIVVHENIQLRKGAKIAWMVRKDNPKLKKSLNQYLHTHKQGTLLGNIYFRRYYENTAALKDPTDLEKWDKLNKYKDIIRKYADMYDFDWLLILALAFQESGLKQSKVSHAGAVGIMQIKPLTARDPNVGIEDINKVENNIHAGVKYLDFLRKRYFSAEDIRPRDRVRLALAAYNAGPARIRQVRALAGEMGLDPNKWFRNVELAALQDIGQETVRYVSNINKYYVLYQSLIR
ncbi:MAG: transglycosylase SLT domain-containing protein [Desulfonatronovibrionaceae bacterium]